MARAILTVWFLLVVAAAGAQAQPRLYIAATTASDTGERGNIPGGAVPSAGALVGLQLSDAWSIELELERSFRTTSVGSGEAVIIAFPPTVNPTREDIELYGIRARSDRRQTAGGGWSAHAVWRSREQGRVNVGLLMGVSSRVYTSRLARTTTFVSPLLDLPPNYRLPDENSSRHMVAGGLTGGLLIFVRVTRHLTVAPELRMTRGLITDDPYSVFRSGVRAMWTFESSANLDFQRDLTGAAKRIRDRTLRLGLLRLLVELPIRPSVIRPIVTETAVTLRQISSATPAGLWPP